ncbi:TIGR03809 family protein [Bradyrhizobium sp. CB82]|uniref:TIGR03809 family protein n=1 Tax=Bradyrhizobium sp. CB82 TaxID=3039159 RepID=UPI0024B08579|nr:TIGR03809 family protein [Bradyrhizobium sp. CB82]WFU45159.1 TIGR03809 family protein [Bradyrhizobium sp. CB82]
MARGRDIAERWCALAEQRLEHLTEMFETGRWRRYHSEVAFLENIQEAKRAVQTWRALADGADVPAMSPVGAVALGWSPAALSREKVRHEHVQTVQPKSVHIVPETVVPVSFASMPERLAEITATPIAPEPPPATPENVVEFTFSLDGIEAKYPLLRNAF